MHNFEKYTEEMLQFEKTALFKKAYKGLVHFLYQEVNREPVYSERLEAAFGIKGSQVRRVIEHARRNGHPVCSGENGYYIETNYDKMMEKSKHLKERAESMLFTYYCLEKYCPEQLNLFVKHRQAA